MPAVANVTGSFGRACGRDARAIDLLISRAGAILEAKGDSTLITSSAVAPNRSTRQTDQVWSGHSLHPPPCMVGASTLAAHDYCTSCSTVLHGLIKKTRSEDLSLATDYIITELGVCRVSGQRKVPL